ncbi:putative sodium/calcium exchanger 7 (Na(+)/Ca(2+)-exchange protein 7) [Aphelenchoides besseyi]|nr:putative sodium/calcium exchanger 7 (Na(+)/Ca(2+)-exchange protein 7) [Aphelenchoides besseyi]
MDTMNSTLNLMVQAATVAPDLIVSSTIGHQLWPHEMDEICSPYGPNVTDSCAYVRLYNDACEGGGYLMWTSLIICEPLQSVRIMFIALAILYMLYLLLFLGSATDDCLCTSISSIVDQLKISQNVAGVTFMAFGNGAADICGMLVQVVATDSPKADLAIGQLLGGGMFVTTVVIASIILYKPFKVMRRPIIRDFVFFLVALLVLLLIIFYDDKMYYWQPLVLLGIYCVYVLTVVFGSSIRMGKFLCFQWETAWIRKQRQKQRQVQDHTNGKPRLMFTELAITTTPPDSAPDVTLTTASPVSGISPLSSSAKVSPALLTIDCIANTPRIRTTSSLTRRRSTIVPVGSSNPASPLKHYRDHGRFFADERDTDSEERDSLGRTAQEASYPVDVVTPSSTASSSPVGDQEKETINRRLLRYIRQAHAQEFYGLDEAPWYSKLIFVLRIPITFVLRLSSPNSMAPWNKWLTVIHCFTVPIISIFAFGFLGVVLIDGGPALWVYSLVVSALVAIPIAIFTKQSTEPKYLKYILPYVGFLVAVSWVYALAAEIVNVVMMFGVVSRVSHVALGITLLAWSNCIGDLIADLAVARQGFPRMAISAAVGGPLLNLLIGFGLSFLVAILQGKTISIPRGELNKIVMILFLCVSLISSLVILTVQRFHAKRFYAYFLLALYVVFIISALIIELGVISF